MIARVHTEARRKQYAMYRLRLAMKRLMSAEAATERMMATRWVNAWSSAVGERWFAATSYGNLGNAATVRPELRGHTHRAL
ncbi:hypothetical protein [Paraburkholderia lycopersici]|uniref:Transposase n=1 Tax=Paraburkholderia lycopersici TaxID=416944 RepID=A0A1G6MQR8_9BURK|nr:hypothetical protein [Paraburkholderia lycopersici]SDC57574.1 hypothetical protein SAMN05421548_10847 [Paraburkholderia lycopersici]